MFFEEQAHIFVQLITFQDPSSFSFHDIYPIKNWLVCWSMSIKSSTLRRLSNGVVCVSRNCWERTLSIATLRKQHSHFDQVTLRMALFKSLPWPWLKLFSSTCSFLPLVLKKNRNQNSEYHGTFTPLRIQLYSKPESLIFLLLWSWRLVLYLYFYVKSKFFAIILVDVQRLHGNGKWILYVSNRAKC